MRARGSTSCELRVDRSTLGRELDLVEVPVNRISRIREQGIYARCYATCNICLATAISEPRRTKPFYHPLEVSVWLQIHRHTTGRSSSRISLRYVHHIIMALRKGSRPSSSKHRRYVSVLFASRTEDGFYRRYHNTLRLFLLIFRCSWSIP